MLERTPIFETGPRFFERDGKPMFEHRVDSRNVIGPREVVKSDVERFPKLWDRFIASRSEKTEGLQTISLRLPFRSLAAVAVHPRCRHELA